MAGDAGRGTQTCALGASPSPRESRSSTGPSRPWREERTAMRTHVPHPRSEGQNTGQRSLLRGEKACEPRSEQKGLHQHLALARSPSEVCGHRQEGQGGKSSPWNKGWPASPSHPRTGTTDAGRTHSKTKGSPKGIVCRLLKQNHERVRKSPCSSHARQKSLVAMGGGKLASPTACSLLPEENVVASRQRSPNGRPLSRGPGPTPGPLRCARGTLEVGGQDPAPGADG